MAFLGPSLRRKKVTDRPVVRVVAAAVASLALNALLLVLLAWLGAFQPVKPATREQVALAPMTASQWNANRAIASAPGVSAPPEAPAPPPEVKPAPTPEVKPPEERQRPSGQVVDVAPSNDSRPPEKSRFLAERDNRVEKETRSRWSGAEAFKHRAPAPVQGGQEKEAGEGGKDQESREAKAGQGGNEGKAGKTQEKPSPQDERLAMLEHPQEPGLVGPGERERPRPPAGEEGAGRPGAPGENQEGQKKLGDPRLIPSARSMARITAGPSADYIDRDIPEGDETALNTRAFKFASFWNRFKQDLSEHWIPAVRTNVLGRDPNGTTFGREDRVTGLHIVLDRGGGVKDVKVIAPSGVDFLDRIAVKSVRDASPYYNVPGGLLDAKGELEFDFGFVVEGNRGIPIRPQWHPAE